MGKVRGPHCSHAAPTRYFTIELFATLLLPTCGKLIFSLAIQDSGLAEKGEIFSSFQVFFERAQRVDLTRGSSLANPPPLQPSLGSQSSQSSWVAAHGTTI